MSQARKVNSNLVGAPGADAHLEVRKFLETFEDAVFRKGGTARPQLGGHSNTADRIARDRQRDSTLFMAHVPMYQRQISLLHRAFGELRCQRPMRGVIPGY